MTWLIAKIDEYAPKIWKSTRSIV